MNQNGLLLENNHPLGTPNLAGSVASMLRQMFLNGELEPGQRVIESEIAERLGVSRGPVREAMRLLQEEHIVEIIPRRGTFVAEMSINDLYDIYSLRGVLEGLAARIVAERADPEAIGQLEACLERLERLKYDLIEFAKLDLQFHEMLCRLSGHQWLYKQWCSMRTYIWLFIRATQVLDAPGYQGMVDLHFEIVEAIRAGLPASAELSARRHSEIAGERLRLVWGKSSGLTQVEMSMLQSVAQDQGGMGLDQVLETDV